MNHEETTRLHFALLRAATHSATADHHCNFLYGYLQGLRDAGSIQSSLYLRLHRMTTKAWCNKIDRLAGKRRAA